MHELRPGQSEVRIGGGVDEVTLIDAAITQLQEARRIFDGGNSDRTSE